MSGWRKRQIGLLESERLCEALPQTTINTSSGRPYVSVIDEDTCFALQLHEYTSRVVVVLDKKCIPELIEALNKIRIEE